MHFPRTRRHREQEARTESRKWHRSSRNRFRRIIGYEPRTTYTRLVGGAHPRIFHRNVTKSPLRNPATPPRRGTYRLRQAPHVPFRSIPTAKIHGNARELLSDDSARYDLMMNSQKCTPQSTCCSPRRKKSFFFFYAILFLRYRTIFRFYD